MLCSSKFQELSRFDHVPLFWYRRNKVEKFHILFLDKDSFRLQTIQLADKYLAGMDMLQYR